MTIKNTNSDNPFRFHLDPWVTSKVNLDDPWKLWSKLMGIGWCYSVFCRTWWFLSCLGNIYIYISGQIIATSHDLTPNGGLVREIPLFQGNLGWWNIIIWPDIYIYTYSWASSTIKKTVFTEPLLFGANACFLPHRPGASTCTWKFHLYSCGCGVLEAILALV